MQLLPVSTVAEMLWMADGLKNDWAASSNIGLIIVLWIADGSSAFGSVEKAWGTSGAKPSFFFFLNCQTFPTFSPHLFLRSLQWCNSRSQAPSVYSLYPDRKGIRPSDQRAGAGAGRINEASGWREGGREGGTDKGRGRLGQVG